MDEKEQIRIGISTLLENLWVMKKHNSEEFMLIKKHKKNIQKYFLDNFGYQLFTGVDLYKLEKIPYQTESWMGIQDFKEPMDYAIFTGILAYLEDKGLDDLFLISTLSDYIKSFFNSEMNLKWELHAHRLSFYRAMKYVQSIELIDTLEGELDTYKNDEREEILYRPTMISKHYMRFFSKPIHEFKNQKEMLMDRWIVAGGETTPRTHLQSIHRKLFFSPVVYKNELSEEEKKYLNHQAFRLVGSIPEYTNFELEIYRNELFLISRERNSSKEQHPSSKTISDIVLQFSTMMKERIELMENKEAIDFEFVVGRRQFDSWIEELQNEVGHGWSKEYREEYSDKVAKKVLEYLEEWKFGVNDTDTHSVILFPPLVRIGGEFPREYKFEKFFVQKMIQHKLNKKSNIDLPMGIFEEILREFNQQFKGTSLRLKSAQDAIDKYVVSSNEDFIDLDLTKINKAFKGE